MSFIGDILGTNDQADAAVNASQTQSASFDKAIEEQKRQYDKIIEMMSPYLTAGGQGLTQYQNLLGANGAPAEQQAIEGLKNSPLYSNMMQSGENSILQNASATGGLRGGNVQNSLGNLGANVLSNLYQNKLGNYYNLANMGQSAAALQANAGQNSSNSVGNLLSSQGNALAQGILSSGQAQSNTIGSLAGLGMTGAAMYSMFSDRRLKKDIVFVEKINGINIYDFNYVWGGERQRGVMAQEVMHIKDAVSTHESGYYMVDYSKLGVL